MSRAQFGLLSGAIMLLCVVLTIKVSPKGSLGELLFQADIRNLVIGAFIFCFIVWRRLEKDVQQAWVNRVRSSLSMLFIVAVVSYFIL
ncbi:hypothetical protein N781_02180 [Pontibacillus halophilus JSM 076056 = DSM 19796]|uniref:Uncharacterized protein n=1 Tax=Pontibacillus halophilus JSM 076056 = DSM 19796 TaxID=1385510 RepID=A0A0A5GSI0_9BACI|nr:hypothetical protein [Pontibacillus halophilus]KGX94105.1 hypothetical protein N781_02180 [Pontibacillus halophilus JSM 076056 = DSM 19796]